MNTIPQDQLMQKQLDRLAAQRHLYSKAKKVLAGQIILSVPPVIIWSLIVLAKPELKVWSAFWGFCVAILDPALFNLWQQSLKQQAAKIQELFDCDVLQLEWRELKVGRRPDAEAIMDSSTKFKKSNSDYSFLKDWYPQVGVLPLHLARIICQRVNCWWDAKLRRRYAVWVITIVVILSVFTFLIGLVGGLTLEKFLLVVLFPLAPVITLGTRQYIEHKQAAEALDRLKEHSEKLWEKAKAKFTSEELTKGSRDLQDEIYDRRCKNPLIFDWIHNRLRRKHEEQMNVGAKELIEEAKAAGFTDITNTNSDDQS